MSALAEIFWKTIGIAAKEDEFAGAAVAEFAEPFGERVRIEVFPCGIEKDYSCGAIGIEFFQSRVAVADFSDFNCVLRSRQGWHAFPGGAFFRA
jgi:hypothetical protein